MSPIILNEYTWLQAEGNYGTFLGACRWRCNGCQGCQKRGDALHSAREAPAAGCDLQQVSLSRDSVLETNLPEARRWFKRNGLGVSGVSSLLYSFRMIGDTLVRCHLCESSMEDPHGPGTWPVGARN